MVEAIAQRQLAPEQIEAFYHNEFVEDQVRDFRQLLEDSGTQGVIVDIGGGCGFFAKRLADAAGRHTRVIDMDPKSVETCQQLGVEARRGDALAPVIEGDEDVVCFNLILHHLVGRTERETRRLQIAAVAAWRGRARRIFVNEYIYESFLGNASGRLIFAITSSSVLSFLGRQVGRVIPAFRANTFGVGVRFRARDEWVRLFAEAGYRVTSMTEGEPEPISPPLRTLLIKTIRRDSFVLETTQTTGRSSN